MSYELYDSHLYSTMKSNLKLNTMNLLIKRISLFLFTLLFANYNFAQETEDKWNLKATKQYKRQAATFADSYEWVSFKYRIIHYFNDSLCWDIVTDVVIKYDNDNSMVFLNDNNLDYILITKDYYRRVDIAKHNLYDISKNRKDKRKTYEELAVFGKIANYFCNPAYFMKPINYANTWALFHIFYDVEIIEAKENTYNKYSSKLVGYGDNVTSFVNNKTNFLDSLYVEQNLDDGSTVRKYITFYDLSCENRQNYIDSIFDFNKAEYASYSKYDEFTMPVKTLFKQMSQGLLDFPLVNLDGDTTSIKEQDGWVLLNFWTTNCAPCLRHLNEYSQEKDSLGYRILENEGVKILAIEHRSNNLEYIRQIASKSNSEDITYSAKEIMTVINIPALGYYYLISPNKEIVYETGDLGDYSEIINKLKVEN